MRVRLKSRGLRNLISPLTSNIGRSNNNNSSSSSSSNYSHIPIRNLLLVTRSIIPAAHRMLALEHNILRCTRLPIPPP